MKTKKLLKVISIILAMIMLIQIIPTSVVALAADELTEIETIEPDISDEVEEAPEAVILGEDESRREESVKHYIMSDHTYKAVRYSSPVHYEQDGEWVDIDNTLAEEEAQDSDDVNGFVNKSNGFKIKFAKKSNGKKLVSIKKDKYGLSWGYDSNIKNKVDAVIKEKTKSDSQFSEYVSETSSSIVYENIDTNLSLEYNVIGNTVKENIIVESKSDEYTYNFELKAQNVNFKTNEDGSIDVLAEDTGELVLAIPAPFMYDAENKISNDVQYTLAAQNGNKYILTVTADSDWINSADTVFPVTIDPVITTKKSRDDIDSTFVASASAHASKNLSAMQILSIGWDTYAYGKTRTLVKFDLPTLNKGDMVIGANLALAAYHKSFYTTTMENQQIDAHVITSSWDYSTVTWNNKPSYDSTVYDYDFIKKTDVENTTNWKYFDITKAVKGWYEGTIANNGIVIKQHVENGTMAENAACAYFWSEKYNEITEAYPQIVINYRNNKGIESYWSYSTADVENAGTAYVNDYTGNLVLTNTLASISSERGSLAIQYVYNGYAAGTKYTAKSNNITTSAGKGWSLNLFQTVRPSSLYGLTGDDATNYPYVYTDGDGTEHYIYKDKDNGNKLVDEDGLGLTLTLSSTENWKYRISDKDGNRLYFNQQGNLYSSQDANNNDIRATYDSTGTQLLSVKDPVGHTYTFSYSSDNYITKITDPSSRVTSFNYGDNGKPAKITFPDGKYIEYEYDSDECLTKARASSGYTVTFAYTSAAKGKRISGVYEKGGTASNPGTTTGQTMKFDRSNYNTTIITTNGSDGYFNTDDDLITTYQFDNVGRTISQQLKRRDGEQSVAGMYNYTSSANLKSANKVSSEASLGKNIVNLATSVNGESLTGWTQYYKTTTTSFAASATEKYVGAKSLAINVSEITASKGNGLLYQNITGITPGETYTFSAYVKTTGIEQAYASTLTGAYLQFRAYSGSEYTDYFSEPISDTTVTAMNNGWRRLTVTATLPDDATSIRIYMGLRNVTGIAYFDCIQVEQSETANDCNLLENAGFETVSSNMPSKWTATNVAYTASTEGSSTAQKLDGSYSMQISGDSSLNKNMKQVVAVYGEPDDTYIVSGWAKANAVPQTNHETAYFELGVLVRYEASDGTTYTENKTSAKFNTSISDWQYTAQAFTLKSDTNSSDTPRHITIYTKYNYQANCVYFDNIQLIKDIAHTYTYDDEGNIISVADNAEQKSNMEYEGSDLVKYTDAKGYNYTYDYDDNHNLLKATSAKGVVTGFEYNSYGQATSSELRNSSSSIVIRTDTSYYPATNGISAGSYVKESVDSRGKKTYYNYDVKKGLVSSVTAPNGTVTSYTYNANNDEITNVSSSGSNVAYSYSGNRLSAITASGTDVSEKYSFVYDAFGNVTQTKIGSTALSTNVYGPNNSSLISSTYGNGDKLEYTYDSYGNVTEIKGNSASRFKWSYDSALNPLSHTDLQNNLSYKYDYDSIGRLIRQEIRNGDSSSHIGSTEFGYDMSNNLTRLTNEIGGRTISQYYSYSAVSGYSNTANYAKDNLPTQYKISGTRHAEYDYDSINRLNLRSFSTDRPLYNNYIYWLATDRNTAAGTTNTYRTTLLKNEIVDNTSYSYTYDDVGNITSIQKGERAVANSSTSTNIINASAYRSYTYDALGQLTRENNVTDNKTTVFSYDGLGNILSKQEYAYTTGSLGTASKTIAYTYSNDNKSGWNNLLTSVDLNGNGTIASNETISYDAIGNPVTYLGKTLSWFGRQLVTFVNGSTTVTNTYDANGLRGTKTVNGETTTYQYIDGKLMYESRPGIELYYFYDSYGNLTSIRYIKAGETTAYSYYVTTNAQGDVLGIYTAAGVQVAAYEYDAWGNCTVYDVTQDSTGNNVFTEVTYSDSQKFNMEFLNPFRYRGYYYDQDMGLYYLQSRYYDPQVGRFISADIMSLTLLTPMGLTDKNVFAYCDNNPVMRIDKTGDLWVALTSMAICGVIGAGVSAAGSLIAQKMSGESFNLKTFALDTATGFVSGAITGSPLGIVGQRILNASVQSVSYMVGTYIEGERITFKGVATVFVSDLFFSTMLDNLIPSTTFYDDFAKINVDLDNIIAREVRRQNAKYANKMIQMAVNNFSDNIIKLATGQFIDAGVNEGLNIIFDIALGMLGIVIGI